MSDLVLTEQDQRWLSGAEGPAMQLAMDITVATAQAVGATELVPIEFAHLNSSFWSGHISTDFASFLVEHGATLAVPTHTNASLIDCGAVRRTGDDFPEEVEGARTLMSLYEQLGATGMWTCAPYHEPVARPTLGTHVAGSESNAVSFYNSVLGARTNKYGDFLDVCAAIVGRVPLTGLHTDDGRRATHRVTIDLNDAQIAAPTLYDVIGIILGTTVGKAVPVVEGLPSASEDQLKALCAAGATSGSVEMVHVVGITPEAPTLKAATQATIPEPHTVIDTTVLEQARQALTTGRADDVDTVCFGTPHFSISEFAALRTALGGRSVAADTTVLVTTSRAVHQELELRGWANEFDAAGVNIVTDTCSYYTPRMRGIGSTVMTSSAKWAYYAPGILGVDVVFASLEACVERAVAGARP